MAGTPRISSAQEIRVMVEHHGLAALDSYEYAVMSMRVGLGFEGRLHSLAEIGTALGITREQARQVEMRALAKLRHPQWSGDVTVHGVFEHQEKTEASPRPYPPEET